MVVLSHTGRTSREISVSPEGSKGGHCAQQVGFLRGGMTRL